VQFAHQANDKPPPLPYIPDMMKKPLPYHPALFQRAVGEMAFLPREALRLSSGIFSKMGDFVGFCTAALGPGSPGLQSPAASLEDEDIRDGNGKYRRAAGATSPPASSRLRALI
jgi:hypothetical protein